MQVRVLQKLIGEEGHEIKTEEIFRGTVKEFDVFVPEKREGEGICAVQYLVEVKRDGLWRPSNMKINPTPKGNLA